VVRAATIVSGATRCARSPGRTLVALAPSPGPRPPRAAPARPRGVAQGAAPATPSRGRRRVRRRRRPWADRRRVPRRSAAPIRGRSSASILPRVAAVSRPAVNSPTASSSGVGATRRPPVEPQQQPGQAWRLRPPHRASGRLRRSMTTASTYFSRASRDRGRCSDCACRCSWFVSCGADPFGGRRLRPVWRRPSARHTLRSGSRRSVGGRSAIVVFVVLEGSANRAASASNVASSRIGGQSPAPTTSPR
jgi:hypothetical protein